MSLSIRRILRRRVALFLCAAILWGTPGPDCYRAFGQALEGSLSRGNGQAIDPSGTSSAVGGAGGVPALKNLSSPLSLASPAQNFLSAPFWNPETPAASGTRFHPAVPAASLPKAGANPAPAPSRPEDDPVAAGSPAPLRGTLDLRTSRSRDLAPTPRGISVSRFSRLASVTQRLRAGIGAALSSLSRPDADLETAHWAARDLQDLNSAPAREPPAQAPAARVPSAFPGSGLEPAAAERSPRTDVSVALPSPAEKTPKTQHTENTEKIGARTLVSLRTPTIFSSPGAATSRNGGLLFRAARVARAAFLALALTLSAWVPAGIAQTAPANPQPHALTSGQTAAQPPAAAAAQIGTQPAPTPGNSNPASQASGNPAPSAPAPTSGQTAASAQSPAQEQRTPAVKAPVSVSVQFDRQDVTVGDPVHIAIQLRNTSRGPIVLRGLRSALDDALPEGLEFSKNPDPSAAQNETVTLGPGESKTLVFELTPFRAPVPGGKGPLEIVDGAVDAEIQGPNGTPIPAQVTLPKAALSVVSVLPPDAEEQGFKPIKGIVAAEAPDLAWLLSLPLAAALLFAAERLLAAKRAYPAGGGKDSSTVRRTLDDIAKLSAAGSSLADQTFYAEFYRILSTFLADYPYAKPDYKPLAERQRSAGELIADLDEAGVLTSGQRSLAQKLAKASDGFRFMGKTADEQQRRQDLQALTDLVQDIDGSAAPAQRPAGMNGFFGLTLSSPWSLLILPVAAAIFLWGWFQRRQAPSHVVSSTATTPAVKTLRQRFPFLPKLLRGAVLTAVIAALTAPVFGIVRYSEERPSVDSELASDGSGSMDLAFDPAHGSLTKEDALKLALKAYVTELRRLGGENRTGLIVFTHEAQQIVPLTWDTNAVLAGIKSQQASGSTAIGNGMLQALTDLIQANIREIDDPRDSRIEILQKKMDDEGLGAALSYLKTKGNEDLLQKALRPDRNKIIVVFSDGDSNSGIATPREVADMIQNLNEKFGLHLLVYAVGIAPKDSTPSDFDETTLQYIAQATHYTQTGNAEPKTGRYYRAGDPESMKEVLLEISRIEKSPVLVVSGLNVKGLAEWLAAVAFLTLSLEIGFSSTKWNTLPAYLLLFTIPASQIPGPVPHAARAPGAQVVVAQVQTPAQAAPPAAAAALRARVPLREILPLKGIPRELAQGNELYAKGMLYETQAQMSGDDAAAQALLNNAQGLFKEAIRQYSAAVERYPDMPELYFNLGDAYLRLAELRQGQGQKDYVEQAVAGWRQYAKQTPDAKGQSAAFYNQGNAALLLQDAEKAAENYIDALRRDPGNQDAKWNLELLQKKQQDQQQEKQDQKNQKQKKSKIGQQGKQGGQSQQQNQNSRRGGNQNGQPSQGQPNNDQQESRTEKNNDQKQDGLDQLIEKQGKLEKQEADAANRRFANPQGHHWTSVPPLAPAAPLAPFTIPFLKGAGGVSLAFLHPLILWAVVAGLGVLAGLLIYGAVKKLRAMRQLSPHAAPDSFRKWRDWKRYLLKSSLVWAAAGLIGLSAAGPVSGIRDTANNFGSDKDIIWGLDGSESGLADDGRGNGEIESLHRLARHMQGGDRVGLVVFAKDAKLVLPLTIDYNALDVKIKSLPREMKKLEEGSNPAAAIVQAAKAFDDTEMLSNRQRVFVLISDGEFLKEDDKTIDWDAVNETIRAAKEHNIKVIAIGHGAVEGAKMKVPAPDGGFKYLQNKDGTDAITKYHPETLKKISEETGGTSFYARNGEAMDRVLERLREMEKGKSAVILHSPQPVTGWFLWPGLILLLLGGAIEIMEMRENRRGRDALAGASNAETSDIAPSRTESVDAGLSDAKASGIRPAPPEPAGARPSAKAAGSFLPAALAFGAGSVPAALASTTGSAPWGHLQSSAWPQIAVLAAIFTAVTGFLLIDGWTGRALTRRWRWAWQRRRQIVKTGFEAEIRSLRKAEGTLFPSLREVEQPRLAAFLDRWRSADDDGRKALIQEASSDSLWRQELAAAFLYPNSSAVQEEILSALSKLRPRRFEPLEPVILSLLSRRPNSAWLDHPDATLRLARLAQAGLDASGEAGRRAISDLTRYPHPEVAAIARQTLRDSGRPVISAAKKTAWQKFERGVALGLSILFMAGNVSGTMFSGIQTVTAYRHQRAEARQTLLRIFYAQEDYRIFTDKYADQRIPGYVLPILKRWYDSSSGSAKDFDQAVAVLRQSSDPKADNVLEVIFKRSDLMPLSKKTQEALLTALMERDSDHIWRFMDEQLVLSANDPQAVERMKEMIDLGIRIHSDNVMFHLFQFLRSPDKDLNRYAERAIYAYLTDAGNAPKFFDRLKDVQKKFGADQTYNLAVEKLLLLRLATIAPDPKDMNKVSGILNGVLGADNQSAERADAVAQLLANAPSGPTATPGAGPQGQLKLSSPDYSELGPTYLDQVLDAAGGVLSESRKNDGPAPAPLEYAGAYLANHVAQHLAEELQDKFPGTRDALVSRHVMKDSYTYRNRYSLNNARDIQNVVREAAEAAAKNGPLKPEQIEFRLREDSALAKIIKLGPLAGLPDGDRPGEKAAEAINDELYEAQAMNGNFFVQLLQKNGLAPDNGILDQNYSLRRNYSAEDLVQLRSYLENMILTGQGVVDPQGKPRPLIWTDKTTLAKLVESVDQTLAQNYPGAPGTSLGRRLVSINSPDPAERAKADQAARALLETRGQENLLLPRLWAAAFRYGAFRDDSRIAEDPSTRDWLRHYLMAQLASPKTANMDPDEAAEVLERLFMVAFNSQEALDAWGAVGDEIARAPAGPRSEALTRAVEGQLKESMNSIIDDLNYNFDGLPERLAAEGILKDWSTKREYYNLSEPRKLLELARRLPEDVRSAGGVASEKQRKSSAVAQALLPRMIDAGAKAGMLEHDPPGLAAAELLNPLIHDVYWATPGNAFIDGLRNAGLEPADMTAYEGSYAKRYSLDKLQRIRAFALEYRKNGPWLENDKKKTDQALDKFLKGLDQIIDYYNHPEKPRPVLANPPTPSPAPANSQNSGDPAMVGAGMALPAILGFAHGGSALFTVALIAAGIWLAAKLLTWLTRPAQAPASEPRLEPSEEVLQRFKELDLAAKDLATSMTPGEFRSKLIGKGGTVPADVAPYAGGPARLINRSYSTKKGELYMNLTEQEKDMPLVLLVDMSASADVKINGKSKRAVIEDAAAMLSLAAAYHDIPVGVALFTDKIEKYIPPKAGRKHAQDVTMQILEFAPEGRGTDLQSALEELQGRLRAKSIVITISDFLTENFKFRGALKTLGEGHHLNLIRVVDTADIKGIPPVKTLLKIRDAEELGQNEKKRKTELWIDPSSPAFQEAQTARIQQREQTLGAISEDAAGNETLTISTEDDLEQRMTAYFSKQGHR